MEVITKKEYLKKKTRKEFSVNNHEYLSLLNSVPLPLFDLSFIEYEILI